MRCFEQSEPLDGASKTPMDSFDNQLEITDLVAFRTCKLSEFKDMDIGTPSHTPTVLNCAMPLPSPPNALSPGRANRMKAATMRPIFF